MSAPAQAACLNGYTDPCSGGGPDDICVLDTTNAVDDTVRCELAENGNGVAADIYVVADGATVEVSGQDSTGSDFCCQLAPNNLTDTTVDVVGGDGNDRIDLFYFDFGTRTFYLLEPVTAASMAVSVLGGEGGDSIFGSDYAGSDYSEELEGGFGNDTIDGRAGDDFLNGAEGNDTLRGGDGDDFILGGGEDDDINGGSGNDDIYGDGTTHWTEPGSDTIDGNGGDDFICSGGVSSPTIEVLSGGSGNDTIWAEPDRFPPFTPPAMPPWTQGYFAEIDGNSGADECSDRRFFPGPPGSSEVNCTLITVDPGCW